ncbi:MAG: hypothetical protein SCK70_08865 [bacterium]|nr:hypothetical protein [bacterium]
MKNKILDEISKIPDEKFIEIFNLIHHFRLELEKESSNVQKILQFAGSWQDLSDEIFNEFLEDVSLRRKKAFAIRRTHETDIG